MRDIKRSGVLAAGLIGLLGLGQPVSAASGTEGAAFLDIPVGGGPAAMGASYTAMANDAYAATWNPGGLGFLDSTQASAQHLSYLDSLHYEYLSFGAPLRAGSGVGGSIQYLGTGDVTRTDDMGNAAGEFSSHYAAYNLAYGQALSDKLSLGLTGKIVQAKLEDISANAFAMDFGAMYKVQSNLTLGGTLTNLGSKLKFLNDGDSLPLAVHLGAAYRPMARWLITSEGVYRKSGLASFHLGGEWKPVGMLALRMGYRTDTVKELSPMAGFSAGVGVAVWGQEIAYAWLPYGDLGDTHYISLVMKFGEAERANRNLIQYQNIKTHRSAKDANIGDATPEYQQLMELLNDSSGHLARQKDTSTNN